ncbi:helix-turn-helix domain-containing protein [Vibrio sp. AND4]|uniref:winged helix-turn-helix domain-containing protein n=1 Tax=Vibrio sp. AND4 TaxID=314289 RepID=UPI00015EFB5C|nr:helix-turn-helix domain-containing protein [Vibrio sp. AND4]EDP60134.1 putative transcriptional regulator ToxR [Vibrio sp. AND4]
MYKRISIDDVRRTIELVDSESGKKDQPLGLNRSEYNLFIAFCDSPGEVLGKATLIEKGWPGRVVGDNSLSVSIMKLRQKLDSLQLGFEISNLPGEGYVFFNENNIEFEYLNEGMQQDKYNEVEEKDGIASNLGSPSVSNDTQNSNTYVMSLKSCLHNPVLYEITIGLVFVALVFFSVYRESFECFECYGKFYG